MEDMEAMCVYIDRESLCTALLTLGDVFQTPTLYSQIEIPTAEQNYYTLAKYLLNSSHMNYKFTILRSQMYRKLALVSHRQHPEHLSTQLVEKSIAQLVCCGSYLQKCCCSESISPLLCEELGYSLLNLADILLRQGSDCSPVLAYLVGLANTHHPLILNHVHYLLSISPAQALWERTFHIFASVGSTYDHSAYFRGITDCGEFCDKVQAVPEDWTLVGLSVGRGNFNDGTAVARLQKGRNPECFVLGNKCCTGAGAARGR